MGAAIKMAQLLDACGAAIGCMYILLRCRLVSLMVIANLSNDSVAEKESFARAAYSTRGTMHASCKFAKLLRQLDGWAEWEGSPEMRIQVAYVCTILACLDHLIAMS